MTSNRSTLIGLTFGCALLFGAAGCQKSSDSEMNGGRNAAATLDQPGEPVAAKSTEATTMIVYGMSCPLCATNIDRQLKRLGGVRQVDVNLDSGEIVAWHDTSGPAPSRDAMQRAIQDSGFTFVRFVDAR